jgi:predicted RNA-binding protein with TRAM domain
MSPKKRSPRNAKSIRGRNRLNVPVELGEEYEVDITEMSPNGEGVARIRGFIIFVANAKLGSRPKVMIKKVDLMSANAEIVAIPKP